MAGFEIILLTGLISLVLFSVLLFVSTMLGGIEIIDGVITIVLLSIVEYSLFVSIGYSFIYCVYSLFLHGTYLI
jgi:hypothetical protein